jgi:hypothetical protein
MNDFITTTPYYKMGVLSVTDVTATREDENNIWELYQVNSFYVEVKCRKENTDNNFKFEMKAFTDVKFLEPYLNDINIEIGIN